LLTVRKEPAHGMSMKSKITAHRRVRTRGLVDHSRFTYELSNLFGTVLTASVSAADAKLATRHGPCSSALLKMMQAIAATADTDYDQLVGREFEDHQG
jgi:hypothetical protein